MQSITLRNPSEPDRNELEKRIVRLVEEHPEYFLEQYEKDSRSFGGRYICADLFKELFPEYAASKETRARYNAVVHNSAAVLAAEQFNRVIADASRPGNEVVFLTGVPGAGKSSSISTKGELFPEYKAVFEGQLSRPETSIPKIQAVLDMGLQPRIIAVHSLPEDALRNTFTRFEETGRGASIGLMADIQGNLPAGLATIRERFGEAVNLTLYDYTDRKNTITYYGWKHVAILQKEGTYEHIKQRLADALARHRAAGTISDGCWDQANGRIPRDFSRHAEMGRRGDGRDQADERGRGVPERDSQQTAIDSILARAREAEREANALLESTKERYTTTLDAYYQAKVAQVGRLEAKLDKAIASQQTKLKGVKAQKPGFFSSRKTKAAWRSRRDQAEKRMDRLLERKHILHTIKTAMGSERLRRLAREKLRSREPGLAREYDAALALEKRRAAQVLAASQERGREQGQSTQSFHQSKITNVAGRDINIVQSAAGNNIVQCAGDIRLKPRKKGLGRQRKVTD